MYEEDLLFPTDASGQGGARSRRADAQLGRYILCLTRRAER